MTKITLRRCIDLADRDAFAACLVSALKALPPGSLPLRAGCEQGGLVDDSDVSVSVLEVDRAAEHDIARVGVFFTELVGGCSCHDDPAHANAYCLLEVAIRRTDGEGTVTPLET